MSQNFENIILAQGFAEFVSTIPTLTYNVLARGCSLAPVNTGEFVVTLDDEISARFENVAVNICCNPEDASAQIWGGYLLSINGGFIDFLFEDSVGQTRANPLSFSWTIFQITNEDTDPTPVSA